MFQFLFQEAKINQAKRIDKIRLGFGCMKVKHWENKRKYEKLKYNYDAFVAARLEQKNGIKGHFSVCFGTEIRLKYIYFES